MERGAGRYWTEDEIRALLSVWSEKNIKNQLHGTLRNKGLFMYIAKRMQQLGVIRDWKQCRAKYKNLKYEYRLIKCGQSVGDVGKARFYDELHAILGSEETAEEEKDNNDRLENEKLLDSTKGTHGDTQSKGVQLIIPPVSNEGGKHWTAKEIRALLNIWSDKNISRQLKGTVRNQKIFEHIARLLQEAGIDRDWRQCRTKYKNLKHEHAVMKKAQETGSKRKTMKYFRELDAIMSGKHTSLKKSLCHTELQRPPAAIEIGKHWTTEEIKALISIWSKPSIRKQLEEMVRNRQIFEHIASLLQKQGIDRDWRQCRTKYKNLKHEYSVMKRAMLSGYKSKTMKFFKELDNILQSKASELSSQSESDEQQPCRKEKGLPDLRPWYFAEMESSTEMKLGKKLNEGKTKEVPITAGNAARKDLMEGKASISNKTTSFIFKLLQEAVIRVSSPPTCEMIPIEWVCRRIANGSFLKRNPGVKEGYKFFLQKLRCFLSGNFEILEKAWATQECTLVDMKIEFGVDVTKKEIVLADVIDNDSWRLWPAGDKTHTKDKQMVKRNFEWVADRVELLLKSNSQGRVVVLMGSISDLAHCEKIRKSCSNYGIPCELRVTSAHKGPDETLRIKSEYEGDGIPTVFIAVAGRSNGLGPVMSGNTAYPVINCPPLTADWGCQDIWSSLRMPSGLGCSTVLSPEAAAQFAAQIFGLNNHLVWSKLRSCTLNTWISLKQADMKLRECSI
ncbi:hypothetical protein GDO86_000408 [Hymenochirus boettgeri]|uniref:Phosphoribosylaminoimidazole carboxylase n=1 Tax=Hymenochirus boettgeri TaxID=247094 RepID=A0A8T2K9D9_9PIPI|nr:hypothetical protein GDO86_000408 [Hymenochirus boettgeri]